MGLPQQTQLQLQLQHHLQHQQQTQLPFPLRPPLHQLQLKSLQRKRNPTTVLSLVAWLVELLVQVFWEEQPTLTRRRVPRSEPCKSKTENLVGGAVPFTSASTSSFSLI